MTPEQRRRAVEVMAREMRGILTPVKWSKASGFEKREYRGRAEIFLTALLKIADVTMKEEG